MSNSDKNNSNSSANPRADACLPSIINDLEKFFEKHFFSRATVQQQENSDSFENLSVVLEFDFGVVQSLNYHSFPLWNEKAEKRYPCLADCPLYFYVLHLEARYGFPIDIEEISFNCTDTSIVAFRIYEKSLPLQLSGLVTIFSEHLAHFTHGLSDIPYEVFLPVYEDVSEVKPKPPTKAKDYLGYWVLYFEGEERPLMYNPKSKELIAGDCHLLDA